MANAELELSESLEDYLEAIYTLYETNDSARVKEIAEKLSVTMPSVNGAIRQLAAKGLVLHKPYESIELTEQGRALAREIAGKHTTIKNFFVKSLGVDPAKAEEEACKIEHAISPETVEKLVSFIDSLNPVQPDTSGAAVCRIERDAEETPELLSQLCPGEKASIVRISGKGPIRKRMMEMGLTRDTVLEVIRSAPFGDPIEIKVRGYLLSLRRSEASMIEIQVI